MLCLVASCHVDYLFCWSRVAHVLLLARCCRLLMTAVDRQQSMPPAVSTVGGHTQSRAALLDFHKGRYG